MDQCYNPDYAVGADYTSDGTTCAAGPLFACYRGSTYGGGNVRLPFGLLYLLAINRIPVSIILNPTKQGLGDPDFTVTPPSTATSPQTATYVSWNGSAYNAVTSAMTCGTNAVSYGGMPFVVDGTYADQALQVITAFNTTNAGFFSPVPLQIINYDFSAPVLGVMGSRPKPVGIDSAPLTTFFDESGITTVVPNGSTYVTINGSSPSFSYTWPSAAVGTNPGCPGDNCTSLTWTPTGGTPQRILDVIWVHNGTYNTWSDVVPWYNAGGNALVVADATGWEASGPGVGGNLGSAVNGAQKGPYCATMGVPTANLNSKPGPTGDYPASNKFLQIGDMNLFVHGVGGGDGSGYLFGATPAPHTDSLTNTVNYTAIAGHPMVPSAGAANATQASGNVIYLGSLNSWHGGSAGKDAGLHIMYNSLLVGGDGNGGINPPSPLWQTVELSRSPAVANTTSQYTGAYYVGSFDWLIPQYPDLAGNSLYVPNKSVYPYETGHFREYKSALQSPGLSLFVCDENDPTSACNWDLADHIPTWANRTVFVGTIAGTGLTRTYSMSPASITDPTINFVANNIGQKLGGVDWAAGAFIEGNRNGSVPNENTRPSIAYVGARDGMLHAICAQPPPAGQPNTTPTCYGKPWKSELWAFIPPSTKTKMDTALATNDWSTVNVGGVIRAADVNDTFVGNTSAKWKTVLVVGTRTGTGSSVFALEVSNPDPAKVNQDDNLRLLWENDGVAVVNTGVTSYKFGSTKGAAMASLKADASDVAAVVTSSTDSSTTAPGINTYLLRIRDGAVTAANQKLYTRLAAGPAGTTLPLANDVPAQVTTLDRNSDGIDETIYVADYEGIVRQMLIDDTHLSTGLLFNGTPTVAFDTATGKCGTNVTCQPIGGSPSIGKYGTTSALGVFVPTGGADWARSATTHSYAMGFDATSGTKFFERDLGTVTPPANTGAGGVAAAMPLRAYAQISIAGTDVFADTTTLSVGNLNSLVLPVLYPGQYGQVWRWSNLNTASIDTVAYGYILSGQSFSGGAGSVIESQATGSGPPNGQLTFVGASTSERVVLSANSSSLRQQQYAIQNGAGTGRNFAVQTWMDLGY
jgi:hypothetical protein